MSEWARIKKSTLTGIGDAIREKEGSSDLIPTSQMKRRILDIKSGTDTSDATATSEDILFGKTAYVNDVKVVGTIEDYDGDYEGEAVNELQAFVNGTLKQYIDNDTTKIRKNLFYGVGALNTVIMPNVSFVDSFAFSGCTGLKVLKLDNCYSTANYALESMGISYINLPIKVLGVGAFRSCQRLLEVSLPECQAINYSAFSPCSALQKVDLPECVWMDGSVFSMCVKLTDVNIPKLNSVPYTCFYACDLSSISLPLCTHIDRTAFAQNDHLSSIYAPFCNFVGSSAFYNNQMLSCISFPFTASIESYVFYSCHSLNTVLYGGGQLYSGVFGNCSNLQSLYLLNKNVTGLVNSSVFSNTPIASMTGNIYVPSEAVESFKISTNWALYADIIQPLPSEFDNEYVYANEFYNSTITEIPENKYNARYVEHYAFANCNQLTSVSLSNVIGIGDSAFYNCKALTSISLPNVEFLGRNAFLSCSNLSIINLPNCKIIEGSAFSRCQNLTTVDLPNCKVVCTQAFYSLSKLEVLNLPECVNLGSSAIYYISNIKQVNLAKCKFFSTSALSFSSTTLQSINMENLYSIPSAMFSNCTKLSDVNFKNCYMIGSSAFYNCKALTSISLPNCKYITGSNAFGNCAALEDIYIPNCLDIGAYAFVACYSLKKAILPKVSRLNQYAFANCSVLKEVDVPLCKYVNTSAFSGCFSLTTLNLPNVSSIGSYAFNNCTKLSSLYLINSSIMATLSSNVFANTPIGQGKGNIYVHQAQYNNYINDSNWSYYADRIVPYEGEV